MKCTAIILNTTVYTQYTCKHYVDRSSIQDNTKNQNKPPTNTSPPPTPTPRVVCGNAIGKKYNNSNNKNNNNNEIIEKETKCLQ